MRLMRANGVHVFGVCLLASALCYIDNLVLMLAMTALTVGWSGAKFSHCLQYAANAISEPSQPQPPSADRHL